MADTHESWIELSRAMWEDHHDAILDGLAEHGVRIDGHEPIPERDCFRLIVAGRHIVRPGRYMMTLGRKGGHVVVSEITHLSDFS